LLVDVGVGWGVGVGVGRIVIAGATSIVSGTPASSVPAQSSRACA